MEAKTSLHGGPMLDSFLGLLAVITIIFSPILVVRCIYDVVCFVAFCGWRYMQEFVWIIRVSVRFGRQACVLSESRSPREGHDGHYKEPSYQDEPAKTTRKPSCKTAHDVRVLVTLGIQKLLSQNATCLRMLNCRQLAVHMEKGSWPEVVRQLQQMHSHTTNEANCYRARKPFRTRQWILVTLSNALCNHKALHDMETLLSVFMNVQKPVVFLMTGGMNDLDPNGRKVAGSNGFHSKLSMQQNGFATSHQNIFQNTLAHCNGLHVKHNSSKDNCQFKNITCDVDIKTVCKPEESVHMAANGNVFRSAFPIYCQTFERKESHQCANAIEIVFAEEEDEDDDFVVFQETGTFGDDACLFSVGEDVCWSSDDEEDFLCSDQDHDSVDDSSTISNMENEDSSEDDSDSIYSDTDGVSDESDAEDGDTEDESDVICSDTDDENNPICSDTDDDNNAICSATDDDNNAIYCKSDDDNDTISCNIDGINDDLDADDERASAEDDDTDDDSDDDTDDESDDDSEREDDPIDTNSDDPRNGKDITNGCLGISTKDAVHTIYNRDAGSTCFKHHTFVDHNLDGSDDYCDSNADSCSSFHTHVPYSQIYKNSYLNLKKLESSEYDSSNPYLMQHKSPVTTNRDLPSCNINFGDKEIDRLYLPTRLVLDPRDGCGTRICNSYPFKTCTGLLVRVKYSCESPDDMDIDMSVQDRAHYQSKNIQPHKVLDAQRKKRVTFAPAEELTKVHHMFTWDFAYRQARKRFWEFYACDRAHFRRRIEQMESILEPVLKNKLEHIVNG